VRFEGGHILAASGREVIEHFDRPAPLQERFFQVRTDKLCPSRNNCLSYAPSLAHALHRPEGPSCSGLSRVHTPCRPWVISSYGCRPEPYGAVRPCSYRFLRLSGGVDYVAAGKDSIHSRLLLVSVE
jgi:hypothetical protein